MKFITKTLSVFFKVILFFLLLSSCSSDKKDGFTKELSQNDTEIYKNALILSLDGKHSKAAEKFELIINNYPYSNLSSRAEIMIAYSHYENNEIQKAILKLTNFIEMNPSDVLSDYAHYMLAMCYYVQISYEGRDPSISKKALSYFKMLEIKYPKSKYTKDGKLKIQFINNHLATNELLVGKFYLGKNSPTAAIKRFKVIIQDYQNSSVIPETLYRLCEAYLMLGLKKEAYKSKALLDYNFSKKKWALLTKKLFDKKIKSNEKKGMAIYIKNYITTIFD